MGKVMAFLAHEGQQSIKQYCCGQGFATGAQIFTHLFVVAAGIVTFEQAYAKILFPGRGSEKLVEQLSSQTVAYPLIDFRQAILLHQFMQPVFDRSLEIRAKASEVQSCPCPKDTSPAVHIHILGQ